MTQRRSWRILAIAVTALAVVGFLTVEYAEAQTFGRVKFIVKTQDEQPVQGVQITVTCAALGKYNKQLKTNKKGEAVLSVVDATKAYQIKVEYEGFPTVDGEVKPKIRDTITREIVLAEGGGSSRPTTPTKAQLTPAQEAFNAGVTAAQGEDFETAKVKFGEAIEQDSTLAPPHLALAGIFYEEQDYEAAIHHASRLVEMEPTNTRGYRLLYESHTALGNKKEAKAARDNLSSLGGGSDSDTVAVIYNEGVAALKVGDDATAKANFLKVLEIQSDLAIAKQALALVYMREGNYAEAASMAEDFLTHEPDNQRILQIRWEAYRALGDSAKEKEAFDALSAADPQVLVTEFFNAGAKLFEAGDAEGARGNFEKVLAIDPEHPRAHYQLGLCLVSSDAEGARKHFNKFLELAPEDPEAASAKEMLSYLQ